MYMHPSLNLMVMHLLGSQMASCKPRFLIYIEDMAFAKTAH